MAWNLIEHPDADALADACTARLAALTSAALQMRGRAALALAGGRTSPPVFRRLAAMPLAWQLVIVVPTDERWVAYGHADCNLRQLREAFAAAQGLRSLPLVPEAASGAADSAYANQQLTALPVLLDAVMLGMGVDGHVASLFPGAPTLAAALDPAGRDDAVAIVPDPMPVAGPHPRISLSLARLLRSRLVMLAITGQDKRATLQLAMTDPSALPVGALLHAGGAPLEVHWSPS